MLLLALETATDVCSVALADGERLVAELTLRRPRAHAENLTPMIGEALRLAKATPADLGAVAVSAGPGSYTGLRIGASTAKGLALATGAHLVAVPSLEAQAAAALPLAAPGDAIAAFFNSRRAEVYAALFARTDSGLDALGGPVALPLADVAAWLAAAKNQRLWLVGEGAGAARERLGETDARLLDPEAFAPSARYGLRQARLRIADERFENVASFEPAYLKAFVAKKPESSIFEKLSF